MQDFFNFLGRFHPLWVHLPIGFLILAALLRGYVWKTQKSQLQDAVCFSLLLGFASSAVAIGLGYLLSQSGGYESDSLDKHFWAAWITLALSAMAWWQSRQASAQLGKAEGITWGLLMAALTFTGHFGGSLTHGEDYLTANLPFGKSESQASVVSLVRAEDALVYRDLIQPVLKTKCEGCHRRGKAKGELLLDSYAHLRKGGENGAILTPGKAEESELIRRVTLPADHDDFMPQEGKRPLTEEEIALISWWIERGNAKEDFNLASADASLLTWAEDRLAIKAGKEATVIALDSLPLQHLEDLGFRVTVLSPKRAALDIVLPADSREDPGKLLQQLLPLKNQIYWLSVAGSGIQDSDLQTIAQFTNLRRLRLDDNPIGTLGVRHLQGLSYLEVLNLNGTLIEAAALESVVGLPSLKSLYVWNTAIEGDEQQLKDLVSRHIKVVAGF